MNAMPTNGSHALRTDLCSRARHYAAQVGAEHYSSRGASGVVLFPRSADGARHGNFQQESFTAILRNAEWAARLKKAHSQRTRALPTPYDTTACELDSCTSSDALLMNVFCYPGAIAGELARLFAVADGTQPRFGVPGAVPLRSGTVDRTEIDMQLGDTFVEAKLTEASFTSKAAAIVEEYRDLDEVFDIHLLPRTPIALDEAEKYSSYQLIRNVLAVSHRPAASLRVLIDARRSDLLEEWESLHNAIRSPELRGRCGTVTWQSIGAAAPEPLREFLALKYGL